MQDTAETTRNFVLYFAMPLWMFMGFADYLCHRATRIERTSGLTESLLHSLMLIEMGIPVVLCLFFEVTPLIIVFMIAVFFLHEVTALMDIAYAQDKRTIWLIETHIHSYLGVLPFMMGSFVICLNWNHFHSLIGLGSEPPRFELNWKRPQISVWYHIAMNTLLLVLLVIPYAEEAWRCYRARRLPRLHPVIPQPANV
ncbi:MAG: hypothetical protein SH850_30355 [Planctomycetaceae bacterium]|nr:hypothetical protein [Planctomycetaceae bacterium]